MSRSTLEDVLAAFAKLEANGYRRPEIPKALLDLATAYLEELRDLPSEVVVAAAGHYIREGGQWWPKVGVLRKAALEVRRQAGAVRRTGASATYWAWERRGWRSEDGREVCPCPICEVLPEGSGRLILRHDHQRHVEAGVVPYLRDQGT